MKHATQNPFRGLLGALLVWSAWLGGGTATAFAAEPGRRLGELDTYWQEVARTVREGDFEGYRATCHEDGVLVSGASQTSTPLARALDRWKQGFLDTKAGRLKASVEFRLGRRWGDETTAHEAGIFLYTTVAADGVRKDSYVHFEALLVRKERWRILMEYQKSPATEAEWKQLAPLVEAVR